MHVAIVERKVDCPFCGEPLHLTLDLSAGGQSYIEDCQVCCQPMQVRFDIDEQGSPRVEVDRAS